MFIASPSARDGLAEIRVVARAAVDVFAGSPAGAAIHRRRRRRPSVTSISSAEGASWALEHRAAAFVVDHDRREQVVTER